jgi:hypothetical protein
MNPEPTVACLETMLTGTGLLPANFVDRVAAPVAEWLDSLGRLQLVTLIEERWDIDIEQELMGGAARRMTLSDLAVLIDNRL